MHIKRLQRIITIPLVIMLLIALLHGYTLGAEKSQSKKIEAQNSEQKQPPSETKTIKKEANPIDLACTALPINYTGHDLESIYKALEARKKSAQKDEYETTEQHKQRVQDEERKPLIGQLGVNDIFSLVVTPESKYNADSQTLTLMVRAGRVMYDNYIDDARIGIDGPTLYYKKSTYMASNAYGAAIEVEKVIKAKVVLAFSNKSALPLNKSTYGVGTFEFELKNNPPEIAKSLREQLRVAFIYKLEKPYLSEGSLFHEPTRDDPTDYFCSLQNVLATSKAVWIFNKANGEFVLKVKVD